MQGRAMCGEGMKKSRGNKYVKIGQPKEEGSTENLFFSGGRGPKKMRPVGELITSHPKEGSPKKREVYFSQFIVGLFVQAHENTRIALR